MNSFLLPDVGMSGTVDFGDFIDSDDGSPIPLLGSDDISPDAFQSLEDTVKHEPGLLDRSHSNLSALHHHTTSPQSTNGSQDSVSDASSSKLAHSIASSKTTFPGGDIMMTDGFDLKPDFNFDDFVHAGDDDGALATFDGTIDPSAIDNGYTFREKAPESQFDFASASSSPSPYTATTADRPSPQSLSAARRNPLRPSLAGTTPVNKGHGKAQSSHSLTRSMNSLTTTGSREVSPFSNMVTSQESSPSALFQSSPSPGFSADASFYSMPAMPAKNSNSNNPGWLPAFNPNTLPAGVAPASMNMPSPIHHLNSSQPQLHAAPFRSIYPCLRIYPTPQKSRVETQIPIKMGLTPLPHGIKRLHLPTHTISKPKLLAKPTAERAPDMLELHTTLVCTSAMQVPEQKEKAFERARMRAQFPGSEPKREDDEEDEENKPKNGGEVQICIGCITRERKRAARKKIKKIEDEELWGRDEHRRVIVFNTQEIKEWQPSSSLVEHGHMGAEFQVDAPMRIACYCRHHAEKLGFQVIFTITDFRGQVVAQAMSHTIMITDDHKTHTVPPSVAGGPADGSETSLLQPSASATPDLGTLIPGGPFRLSHSSSDLQSLKRNMSVTFPLPLPCGKSSQPSSTIPTPRNLSRPASPTALNGPFNKKRKASGSAKVPSGLAMTRLETSQFPPSQAPSGQTSAVASAAVSPFSPSLPTFPIAQEPLFAQAAAPPLGLVSAIGPPFTAGPPTPNSNSNDQAMFSTANRSASLENMSMQQIYSAPTSAHASRAPSPTGVASNADALLPQQQFAQALASFQLPVGLSAPQLPPSVIHKIIPNEGPKSGGIEVTILGSGFYQGLEVMFGDIRATTTTFWGESSLVCLLPPSPVAGSVYVAFKQPSSPSSQPFSSKPQPVFKYIDDDEQQLMRNALTVLGHKMNGTFEDVSDVARRIIGDSNSSWGSSPASGGTQSSSGAGFNSFGMSIETQLLKVLDLIDLDDSPHKVRLNLRRALTGHTMLHLACSLGLHRFAAGLLARGANPDLRDKGGYTPMHLAALNNHPEIIRKLIQYRADPTIRTLSGLTAADLARSKDTVRAVRLVERHARSRSGGSAHSRANSATSLKSLWDPQQLEQYGTGHEDPEESPEYSTEDNETSGDDEDPDADDSQWLDMRRRSSGHIHRLEGRGSRLVHVLHDDVDSGLTTPTGAVAAFRDQFAAQFQQFQQAMALHLQNLPQLPNLPQMPTFSGMPPLPDYQAYLYPAPMIQRLSALVPNIGVGRPGSAGEQSTKEMDGRWWYLSSLMNTATPPPAYSDIFPQTDDMDRKQVSAAQAAAEAEADGKCAMLYDQASVSVSVAPKATPSAPVLLQIGRKHAITREQQENLRRAHAEKLKRISRDRNLFFIWIPLLVLVLGAMLYNQSPGLFVGVWNAMTNLVNMPKPNLSGERIVEVL